MSTLYIVATPIGNLEDITLRAIRILKEVDAVFCEDTRVTAKLLSHYEIRKPMVSLRERAQDHAIAKAIAMLEEGRNIAYTSDAGTPGICDPGGKLVARVCETLGSAVTITPLPGSSAIAAAASISGISTDKFLFMGYPPHKKGRKKYFAEVATSAHPVIFYESPHRIVRSLNELSAACKAQPVSTDQRVIVCRELTKKFETIYRGNVEVILPEVEKNPRGEFVVIVENK